jgi:thymidine kinase
MMSSKRAGSFRKPLGSLTVVCGSMFAGKSEELIRLARRALYAKKKVQVFKPAIDNRYDETMVVTHMGVKHEAIPVRSVRELVESIESDTQVICIEEAQFFDVSLVKHCVKWADEGRQVICAGLDQDFRREPFGPMAALLCSADEVIKLRAICMNCGAPASHTYRQIDGKPAHWDDPIVLIGATEAYEARCRNCFEILTGKPVKRSGAAPPKQKSQRT